MSSLSALIHINRLDLYWCWPEHLTINIFKSISRFFPETFDYAINIDQRWWYCQGMNLKRKLFDFGLNHIGRNFIIFFLRTICQVSVWDSFLFIAFCFTKTKTQNWKTSSTKSLNMIFNTIRKLAFFFALPCSWSNVSVSDVLFGREW